MSIWRTLKQGQQYLENWPSIKQLAMIFPENRMMKSTKVAIRFAPFVAVFSIVWQQIYAPYDHNALAMAVLTALVALSLPLQGLFWLGKRANTALIGETLNWYWKIEQKLDREYDIAPVSLKQPTYLDLAKILNKAQEKFPPEFWEEI